MKLEYKIFHLEEKLIEPVASWGMLGQSGALYMGGPLRSPTPLRSGGIPLVNTFIRGSDGEHIFEGDRVSRVCGDACVDIHKGFVAFSLKDQAFMIVEDDGLRAYLVHENPFGSVSPIEVVCRHDEESACECDLTRMCDVVMEQNGYE